jgi:hypothetical protein
VRAALLAISLAACTSSTGGQIVSFDVAAAGPADATGGSRTFDNGLGWHVVLSKASLHIGAVYMNATVPTSGAQFTNCILPGLYTAEELSGLDVDVLSASPQPFPAKGEGTDDEVKTGELWLTSGDINAGADPQVIAQIAGVASSATITKPFTATVTIGANRAIPSSDPAHPSAHPICKQRIVSPIAIDLAPRDGGRLLIRVDPAAWFANVDFSTVPSVSTTPPAFEIPDDNATDAGQNLFSGLRSAGSANYRFTFE